MVIAVSELNMFLAATLVNLTEFICSKGLTKVSSFKRFEKSPYFGIDILEFWAKFIVISSIDLNAEL